METTKEGTWKMTLKGGEQSRIEKKFPNPPSPQGQGFYVQWLDLKGRSRRRLIYGTCADDVLDKARRGGIAGARIAGAFGPSADARSG